MFGNDPPQVDQSVNTDFLTSLKGLEPILAIHLAITVKIELIMQEIHLYAIEG